MSRIVALVSSPIVGGNTDSIVEVILDGAMGLSTNEIVLYRLDKLRFAHGCRNCKACKTQGRCVQDDEISDVLDDIRRSDIVIASTPLYFGGVSAQYKMLEDRMYSFFDSGSRPTIPAGKKAVVVVSCSFDTKTANSVANHMADVLKHLGFEVLDRVVFVDDKGESRARDDEDLLKKMKQLGSTFRNTRVVREYHI